MSASLETQLPLNLVLGVMDLVEGLTLTIAVTALHVAISQLRAQRKHNRLSVKPIPTLECLNLVKRVTISIRNIGTGPCYIRNMKVSGPPGSAQSVFELMPKRPDDVMWNRYAAPGDRVIAAGEELILISYTSRWKSSESRAFLNQVRDQLNGLEISFDYTDIYDTEFNRVELTPLETPNDTSKLANTENENDA